MSRALSASIFTGLASAAILFQLALVAGAPWGALTQGGRVVGSLPGSARLIALVSAALLLCFVHIVRGRAQTGAPTRFRRLIWIVVAYCALGIVANAATPSRAERILWLPVVSLMFLASVHVARGAPYNP